MPKPDLRFESTGLWLWVEFKYPTGRTTQEKLLALLRADPSATRKGLAIAEDGVKYHLDKLKAAGVIRRIGSTKGGTREVLS